jgi:hypothetical protein
MDFSQRQLLCTFATLSYYEADIENLSHTYKIDGDIYVLQNEIYPDEVYLTYNVRRDTTSSRYPKTISVHRKKDFNVIYSINALNLMAGGNFSGSLDHRYEIDWNRYKNSLVIVNGNSILAFPTMLLKIVRPSV